MLELLVKFDEMFDETSDEFISAISVRLRLEHSLVSLSKWESFYKKPFLSKEDKTDEEIRFYIRLMNIDPDVGSEVFHRLQEEHFNAVNEYINDPQTATWFSEDSSAKRNTEVITAELIYYWMIAFTIPVEFETWHLNRLLTLIRVCNLKNSKPKKMGRAEAAAKQRTLNEQRLREFGTTG
jgi:hypothetical protein